MPREITMSNVTNEQLQNLRALVSCEKLQVTVEIARSINSNGSFMPFDATIIFFSSVAFACCHFIIIINVVVM